MIGGVHRLVESGVLGNDTSLNAIRSSGAERASG